MLSLQKGTTRNCFVPSRVLDSQKRAWCNLFRMLCA